MIILTENINNTTSKNEYEKRVVAFIDILGFKEMVKRSEQDADFTAAIYGAMKSIDSINRKDEESKGFVDYELDYVVFSDSIIISCSCNVPGSLCAVLIHVLALQISLLQEGVLIRGGITAGNMIHNGRIAFGPAVIKAYKLESTIAKYPRIVLDEGILDNIENSGLDEVGYTDLLKRDENNVLFTNHINAARWLCRGTYTQYLKNLREFIMDNLFSCKLPDNVMLKYTWLKDYFNNEMNKQGRIDMIIDIQH